MDALEKVRKALSISVAPWHDSQKQTKFRPV